MKVEDMKIKVEDIKMSQDKILCPFCRTELSRVVTVCNGCGAERRDDEFSQEGKIVVYLIVAISLLIGWVSQNLILFFFTFVFLFALLGIFGRRIMFVPKTRWRPSSKKIKEYL